MALETSFDMGVYTNLTISNQLYDVVPAREARDGLRQDLLSRFAWLRARIGALESGEGPPPVPEPIYEPRRITEDPTARDVLLALITAVWKIAGEHDEKRSRPKAFKLIQQFNAVLRPMGWEYLLRPGGIITLRVPKKRWTWADETR